MQQRRGNDELPAMRLWTWQPRYHLDFSLAHDAFNTVLYELLNAYVAAAHLWPQTDATTLQLHVGQQQQIQDSLLPRESP